MGKLEKKEYSVKEYANHKNCSVSAVYKAISENRVAFKKIGSTYIVIE